MQNYPVGKESKDVILDMLDEILLIVHCKVVIIQQIWILTHLAYIANG